jgi:predicted transcriptional regulator
MPSTSVHLPDDLIAALDRAAKRRRVSRNRLIIDACRALLGSGSSVWPEDFFTADRLTSRDRRVLQESFEEWNDAIAAARHSKRKAPF